MDRTLAWILGGAALGVGILWIRSRQAAKATDPNANACENISAATGIPKGACDIGLPVVQDIVGGIVDAVDSVAKTSADVEKWDLENKALNGSIEIHNRGFYAELAKTSAANGAPAVDGSVVRFDNGCVPMRGADGWEKCARGTHNMLNYPILQASTFVPDRESGKAYASYSPDAVAPMSGEARYEGEAMEPYDPYTRGSFGVPNGGPNNGALNGQPFPIPIPPGHVGYLYKGRPFTCPAGQPPSMNVRGVTDPDYIPPCAEPRRDSAVGTLEGLGTAASWGTLGQARESNAIADCTKDPNFTWDPAGYCRRKRVGEP